MESDTISDIITVSDYSGGCPQCGANNGFLNVVGRAHWLACDTHKTKWCIGSNLFSDWKEENEAIWLQNAEKLAGYSEVEPLPEGVWSADRESQQRELKEDRRKKIEWDERERRLGPVREKVAAILQDALKTIPPSLQEGDEVHVNVLGLGRYLSITSAGIVLDDSDDLPF